MSFVERIVESISTTLAAVGCLKTAKIYGLAETIRKDDREMPACATPNGTGKAIIPDQAMPIQIYFRLSSNEIEEQEEGFGEVSHSVKLTLGLYLVGAARAFTGTCTGSQEAAYSLLADSLPDGLLSITNAWNVRIGAIRRSGTKDEVMAREYPGWEWQNHILDLIAVGIEFDVTGVSCDSTC